MTYEWHVLNDLLRYINNQWLSWHEFQKVKLHEKQMNLQKVDPDLGLYLSHYTTVNRGSNTERVLGVIFIQPCQYGGIFW